MKTTKSIKEIHDEEQWDAFLAKMEELNRFFLKQLSPWQRFKIRCANFFWDVVSFVISLHFKL